MMLLLCLFSMCYGDIMCGGYNVGIMVLGLIRYFVYYYYFMYLVCSMLGLYVGNSMLLDNTIIMGNVMDMYVLGLIGVTLIGYVYMGVLGWSWMSYMWYYSVMGWEYFLCLFIGMELCAHSFQSLTLSNSICINIMAGCLFSYLIGLLVMYNIIVLFMYMGMSGYEFINIGFQYGVFVFLMMSLILW